MVVPNPEFRQRVRTLGESRWGGPVVALYLDDVSPTFEVPGRRKDGTVEGENLVRRSLWNVVRGTVGVAVNAVLLAGGGGAGNTSVRSGRVTGPANAQALGLVDAAKSAKGPWLVFTATPGGDWWSGFSPSHIAVVDTGHTFYDPKDSPPPTILWHAEKPNAPLISPRRQRLTWPDRSVYQFHVGGEEASYLEQNL